MTTDPTPLEALRALPKKWRNEADECEDNAAEADSIGLNDAAKASAKSAQVRRELADELEALATPGAPETGSWIAADDVYRMAREIDVALNGEEGAAKRPALCDVTGQIVAEARKRGPLLATPGAGPVDGAWRRWRGGPCPVPAGAEVEYRMRGHGDETSTDTAGSLDWSHGSRELSAGAEIVEYRTATPAPVAVESVIGENFEAWFSRQDCRTDWRELVRLAYLAHPAPEAAAQVTDGLWREAYRSMAYQVYAHKGHGQLACYEMAQADIESREREFAALRPGASAGEVDRG